MADVLVVFTRAYSHNKS